MEQWEILLRKELNTEIPDGLYNIGSGKMVAYTGKQGCINYLIELEKECIGLSISIRKQIKKAKENYEHTRDNGTDSKTN